MNQWSEVAVIVMYMTSTNSYMNAEGDVLISMVVSTDGRLQVIRWALDTDSPKTEPKKEPDVVLSTGLIVNKPIYPNLSTTGLVILSVPTRYELYTLGGELLMEENGDKVNLKAWIRCG